MEEALTARRLLAEWTGKAWLIAKGEYKDDTPKAELAEIGHKLMRNDPDTVKSLDIFGENMEKSHRKVRILKTYKAYNAYGNMLTYYAVKNVLSYLENNPQESFASISNLQKKARVSDWVNLVKL